MALTPLDIQNKSFSTKMRGYNQDEVDDFLDMIVRDYEAVLQENREMEKAIKHSEEKLEYFNELKDALNQSIIVAQDTADKVKTSASKESEVLVTSAQNKADELVANAEARAREINEKAEEKAREMLTEATAQAIQLANETNDLKKKTRVFHQQLMLLVQSQLEQTKAPEWDEVLKPLSTYVDNSDTLIKEVLGKNLDTPVVDEVNSVTDTAFEEAADNSFTIEMPEVITTSDDE